MKLHFYFYFSQGWAWSGRGEHRVDSFVDSRKKNAVQVRSCTQDILKETPVCSRRHSLLLTLTSPISEACF